MFQPGCLLPDRSRNRRSLKRSEDHKRPGRQGQRCVSASKIYSVDAQVRYLFVCLFLIVLKQKNGNRSEQQRLRAQVWPHKSAHYIPFSVPGRQDAEALSPVLCGQRSLSRRWT